MKKGIIATAALAMVLGAGVAVCAHQPAVKGASADPCPVRFAGSVNGWVAEDMSLSGDYYTYVHDFAVNDTFKVIVTKNATDYWISADWDGVTLIDGIADDNSGDHNFKVTSAGTYLIRAASGITGYDDLGYGLSFYKQSDPSNEKNTFYVHDPDELLSDTFADIKVYGFGQEPTIKAMTWPGTHSGITETTLGGKSVYQVQLSVSYPNFIINDGTIQTADITDLNDHKGDVLYLYDDSGLKSSWRKAEDYTDYPAEDGYYLVGSETDWKFAGAPKLGTGDESNYGNLLRYSAKKDEEFKVKGYFSGVSTWYDSYDTHGDYVVANDGIINVRLSKSDNEFRVETDIPATDGYYIKGSALGSWSWSGAVKMTNTGETDPTKNQAYKMDLTVAENDEIRACGYYTDRVTYLEWATVGESYEFGAVSGDNFKFSKAGSYDFYVKYSDGLKVYIAEHVPSYTIQMTAVLYNGGAYDSTVDMPSQKAYAETDFDPGEPSRDGYVFRGVFTNVDCAAGHEYTTTQFDADGHLYVKYTKVGFYLESGATSWSIDGAVLMQTEGIGGTNKAEASVTVAAVNETYLPVYYDASGTTHYPADGVLGKAYDGLATVDEGGHIKFLKTGTFAIYWSDEYKGGDNKVYLNEGLAAFLSNFMTVTGGICKTDNTTSLSALKAAWSSFASAYSDLKADEKKVITDVTYSGGKEDGKDEEKFMARYAYILNRYGTSNLSDFIFNETRPGNPAAINVVESNNNITIVAIVAITAISASLVLVLIRKRKHQ